MNVRSNRFLLHLVYDIVYVVCYNQFSLTYQCLVSKHKKTMYVYKYNCTSHLSKHTTYYRRLPVCARKLTSSHVSVLVFSGSCNFVVAYVYIRQVLCTFTLQYIYNSSDEPLRKLTFQQDTVWPTSRIGIIHTGKIMVSVCNHLVVTIMGNNARIPTIC